MQITDNGRPLSRTDWLNIEVFLLEIDNTAYHSRTGVAAQVAHNFCERANNDDALLPLRRLWHENGLTAPNGDVTPEHLEHVQPWMVNFYRRLGQDKLFSFLLDTYKADYSAIPYQPDFVEAVEDLREDGKKVAIYTSSPFGEFFGRKMHANHTLEAIGFAPDAFRENDVVDLIKPDRLPGLAHGPFTKTKAGFLQVCKHLGIEPLPQRESYAHVACLDYKAPSFSGLGELGVNRILIGGCEKPLANEPHGEHAQIKVWQDEKDLRGRYFSTAGCLLSAVAALKPVHPRSRRYSTKGHHIQEGERPWYLPDFARLEP